MVGGKDVKLGIVYKYKDMPRNYPKVLQSTWESIRVEFEGGSYVSLKELSKKYNISYQSLRDKIYREKWNERQTTLQTKVLQKLEEVKVDLGTEYLKNSFLRAKRWERIIDKSIDQVGECLEPQDANALSQTEARTHALALSALRLPSVVQPLDIRSNGLSIGESIVSAIARLRSQGNVPQLSNEQVTELVECEVIPDKPS